MKQTINKYINHNVYILCTLCAVGALAAISGIGISDTSALTYQKSTDVNFTINPSVSITLSSSDLVINDLAPNSNADSNIINVKVESNNSTGYTLKSSVGNSTTYNTDALIHDSDNNASFTNLSAIGSLSAGKWGYSFSTDNGTTWYGGYDNDELVAGYGGLPLYNTAPASLITTSTQAESNIKFKIGAYATDMQASGEYNNVVNFVATVNPAPEPGPSKLYMQDLDSASCAVNVGQGSNPAGVGDEIAVIDSRDNKEYTVRYINDTCWMTQNLAIEPGTEMTADNTNIASTYTSSSPYILPDSGYDLRDDGASSDNCYGSASSGDGWINACTHMANSADVNEAGNVYTAAQLGAWYNYAAATAGSVTGIDNNVISAYDICPSNWKLPTYDDISTVVSYTDYFSPTYGGNYYQGSHSGATTNGTLWSSELNGAKSVYYLRYRDGQMTTGSSYRIYGFRIRCITKN